MLDYLLINGSNTNSKVVVTYTACGKTICRALWLEILGVSQNRFRRICNQFMAGIVMLETIHPRLLSLRSNEAIAWMKDYFDR